MVSLLLTLLMDYSYRRIIYKVRADLPVGPHREPPSVQTYQTHIFAPPVTGAPTKKTKGGQAVGASSATIAGVGNNVQVPASQLVTLNTRGVVVSGGPFLFLFPLNVYESLALICSLFFF